MPLDDQIKETTDRLVAHLRDEIGAELRRVLEPLVEAERAAAAREARQAAQAEAARTLAAELDRARRQAEERLTVELDALRRDGERQLESRLAAARTEADETRETAVSRARAAERDWVIAAVERLLGAARRIDDSRSLTDALEALVRAACDDVPRVAALFVEGSRARVWRSVGIEAEAPPGRVVDLDAPEAGLVGRAAESGRSAIRTATGTHTDSDFVPTAAGVVALATPLKVGGRVVAILYADDGGSASPETPVWPQVIELLARYAARSLETLTARRASQIGAISWMADRRVPRSPAPETAADSVQSTPAVETAVTAPVAPVAAVAVAEPPVESGAASDSTGDEGARRYARLLVSEIKLYNEAAVKMGRQKRDLIDRLRPEIDRARKLYEERVAQDIRARTSYFEQELVRTLADGDSGLLGVMRP